MTKSPLGIKEDDVFIRFTERTQEQGTFFYNLIYLPTSLFLFGAYTTDGPILLCMDSMFLCTHALRKRKYFPATLILLERRLDGWWYFPIIIIMCALVNQTGHHVTASQSEEGGGNLEACTIKRSAISPIYQCIRISEVSFFATSGYPSLTNQFMIKVERFLCLLDKSGTPPRDFSFPVFWLVPLLRISTCSLHFR